MDKSTYIHSRRDFLNLPFHNEDASMASTITINTKSYNSEVSLQIRDCNDKVRLSFCIEEERDHINNLHKVDTMISHLVAFRDALIKGREEFIRQSAEEKKEEEKKRLERSSK